jgi:hypothetical protein
LRICQQKYLHLSRFIHLRIKGELTSGQIPCWINDKYIFSDTCIFHTPWLPLTPSWMIAHMMQNNPPILHAKWKDRSCAILETWYSILENERSCPFSYRKIDVGNILTKKQGQHGVVFLEHKLCMAYLKIYNKNLTSSLDLSLQIPVRKY